MKLLDTLLGRTKPVQANLDSLFSLPSAVITLESSAGIRFSGRAGVCFKPLAGEVFHEAEDEATTLGGSPDPSAAPGGSTGAPAVSLHTVGDSYGYRWVVVNDADIEDLVTRVHMVNTTLADAGYGPQLLCSVFGLTDAQAGSSGAHGGALGPQAVKDDPPASLGGGISAGSVEVPRDVGGDSVPASTSYIVYLYKRGTFYPFAPRSREQRDNELELRLKAVLQSDLRMEAELDRWFPLWGLPVG